MRDITNKLITMRTAKASAVIKTSAKSIKAIKNNTTLKRDVLPTARAAAFLAVKNTSNVIPYCHPIPVESVTVEYEFSSERIKINISVKTQYKTGCEMEALYGVSVCALTVYDMLKIQDGDVGITDIKLEEKSGGKSDFADLIPGKIKSLKTAIIVISDSASSGIRKDKTGGLIKTKLKSFGIGVKEFIVIPDEAGEIRKAIKTLCNKKMNLILTAGGTGVSSRDITPETIKPLIEKDVPGIIEAARSYGQKKTPLAMLSRGVAGLIGKTLIITLPGSPSAAEDCINALFPQDLHIYSVIKTGYKH